MYTLHYPQYKELYVFAIYVHIRIMTLLGSDIVLNDTNDTDTDTNTDVGTGTL